METQAKALPTLVRIPLEKLENFNFWGRLEKREQASLKEITAGITAEARVQFDSVLRTGKYLDQLYEITNPYGAFLRTVKALWGDYISPSTAYRWRNVYLNLRETYMSEKVLDAVIASNVNLVGYDPNRPFGKYTDQVKKLPPPKDPRDVPAWIEKIKERKAKADAQMPELVDLDPNEATKDTFIEFRNRYRRLPRGKARNDFVEDSIAYMMWTHGMSGHHFKAAAPPEDWQNVKRGRPREKDRAA